MSKQLGDILENHNFIWLRGHTTLEMMLGSFRNYNIMDFLE